MTLTRFCKTLSTTTLFALSLALLSACASQDDGDSYSLSAPVAAGQAIQIDHMISHMPGQAWRLTYRSSDARNPNQLVRVSAEVLIPRGTPPAGGWPVLAWGHGESGLHLTCAPSVMGLGTMQEHFYAPWLQQGFAIVATDYPGLGEPGDALLLNARSEGMSMLDSVRAAHARFPDISLTTVLSGHSQGAQAALAASAIATTYAPQLHIVGTVAVAPPYLDAQGVQDLLRPRNPRSFSPAVPELLSLGASLSQADPSFDPNAVFTTRALALMHDAATTCSSDFFPMAHRSGLTPATMLRPGAEAVLTPALKWAEYPSLSLSTPVMIATGTQDLHSYPNEQQRLVSALCAAGTSVTHHTYGGASHNGTLSSVTTDAHTFVRTLMSGQTPPSSCPAR